MKYWGAVRPSILDVAAAHGDDKKSLVDEANSLVVTHADKDWRVLRLG